MPPKDDDAGNEPEETKDSGSASEETKAPTSKSGRTKAELEIDKKVEAETKREAQIRADQDKMEQARKENDFKISENSLHTRALDASLGKIEHMGCRGLYVGRAPQSEKGKSLCPTCQQPLTGGNSHFTPLPFVKPEPGLLVKDPTSGEFFALPGDGTLDLATPETWISIINPATGKNVVPEVSKAGTKERREAAGLAAA